MYSIYLDLYRIISGSGYPQLLLFGTSLAKEMKRARYLPIFAGRDFGNT